MVCTEAYRAKPSTETHELSSVTCTLDGIHTKSRNTLLAEVTHDISYELVDAVWIATNGIRSFSSSFLPRSFLRLPAGTGKGTGGHLLHP